MLHLATQIFPSRYKPLIQLVQLFVEIKHVAQDELQTKG